MGNEEKIKAYFCYALVIIIIAFNLITTASFLSDGLPNGGDNVSHLNLLENTAEVLKEFTTTGKLTLWNPDYYTGFPMFYFYSPLPYFFLAIIHLITTISLLTLQKIAIVLLFSFLPFIFFKTMRVLNQSMTIATVAAIISTLFSSFTLFGLEFYAFFSSGLFAQLFAIFFLPLAIAYTYQYLTTKTSSSSSSSSSSFSFYKAILFTTITIVSHILIGLMLVVLTLCMLVALYKEWKTTMVRFLKLYAIIFLLVAFLFVPYLTDSSSFPGLPLDNTLKTDGLGLQLTITSFFKGEFLDYSFPEGRLPLLTILAMASIFFLFTKKQRKQPFNTFLLISLCITTIIIAGKHTFPFLNVIPGLNAIQPFRFIAAFHFIAILIISITAGNIIEHLYKKTKNISSINKLITKILTSDTKRYIFFFTIFILLLTPILAERFATYKANAITHPLTEEYNLLTESLKESNIQGRILDERNEHLETLQFHHFIPLETTLPLVNGRAIGDHDTLTAYYLTDLPKKKATLDLFNVDVIIENEKTTYTDKGNVVGYFGTTNPGIILNTKPVGARETLFAWVRSPLPEKNIHFVVKEQSKQQLENGNTITITPKESKEQYITTEDTGEFYTVNTIIKEENTPQLIVTHEKSTKETNAKEFFSEIQSLPSCGEILNEEYKRGMYKATVQTHKDCMVFLKVSYHKEWGVKVNQEQKELLYISPSFMGVQVPEGQHEIIFQYTVSTQRKILFFLTLITTFFLVIAYYKQKTLKTKKDDRS